MKRGPVIVAVLLAAGAGAYFTKDSWLPKQPLASGTPVKLMLMRQLESGKDAEGAEVPFVVTEDVKTEKGGIAIAKGSVVKGTVSQSRGEGMLSGLMNKPARLEVKFVEVKTVDGQTLRLAANTTGADDGHDFTRSNTGKVDLAERLDRIKGDADVQSTLKQIQDSFTTGKAPDFSDPKSKEALAKIAKELDLKSLGDAVAQDRAPEIAEFMGSANKAKTTVGALSSGNLTFAAVMELADVAGDVGSKLSQMIRGRTIRAYPGTEVTAYTAEKTQVRAK